MPSYLLFLLNIIPLFKISFQTINNPNSFLSNNYQEEDTITKVIPEVVPVEESQLKEEFNSTVYTIDLIVEEIDKAQEKNALIFNPDNVLNTSEVTILKKLTSQLQNKAFCTFVILVEEMSEPTSNIQAELIAERMDQYLIPLDESIYLLSAIKQKSIGIFVGKAIKNSLSSDVSSYLESQARIDASNNLFMEANEKFLSGVLSHIKTEWPSWTSIAIGVGAVIVIIIIFAISIRACPECALMKLCLGEKRKKKKHRYH